MTITDISDARARRQRILDAAGWVAANVPFTLYWPDYPAFHSQWPDMTGSEIAQIDAEVHRILIELAEKADSAADLPARQARYEWWTRAANWLVRYSDANLDDEQFQRHFGHLTRNEVALALIEAAKRRVCTE